MRIVINKIERECEILPAPPNSFWVSKGLYGFPIYVAIAPAITEHEKSCGNIVTCPICCTNGGYDSAEPAEIHNYLSMLVFCSLIETHLRLGIYDERPDAALYIQLAFEAHGIKMDDEVVKFVKELCKDKTDQ